MTDADDDPAACIVCATPTTDHIVPHGQVCHDCWTRAPPSEIAAALPGGTLDEPTPETDVECLWCETTHALAAVAAVVGTSEDRDGPLSSFRGIALTMCPECDGVTQRLTSYEAADRLADELTGLDTTEDIGVGFDRFRPTRSGGV